MPGAPRIGVVTMTRNRVGLLSRAIASVQQQDTAAVVHHLIVADDCPDTAAYLSACEGELPANVSWVNRPRSPQEAYDLGSHRCAKLRNFATRTLNTDWVAFLDDDNEWERDHLGSLLACATAGKVQAVHSQRKLLYRDGSPYLEERYPWISDAARSADVFKRLTEKGVFTPGSCVMADRVTPGARDYPAAEIVDPGIDPIVMVDPNEWMLARELLLERPFTEDFTPQLDIGLYEDGKFLLDLIQAGVPIAGSGKPTLRYYLGGFSTDRRN